MVTDIIPVKIAIIAILMLVASCSVSALFHTPLEISFALVLTALHSAIILVSRVTAREVTPCSPIHREQAEAASQADHKDRVSKKPRGRRKKAAKGGKRGPPDMP